MNGDSLYCFYLLLASQVLNTCVKRKHHINKSGICFHLFQIYSFNFIAIANKYDLNKTEVSYPSDLKIIKISAKEKKGIDALKKEIIGIFSNERSENENIIVTNARHYQAFLKSLEALENVILGMDNDVPSDILAMDIRQSLNHISTITGEIVTDDLLESIFTRFCIGKQILC